MDAKDKQILNKQASNIYETSEGAEKDQRFINKDDANYIITFQEVKPQRKKKMNMTGTKWNIQIPQDQRAL